MLSAVVPDGAFDMSPGTAIGWGLPGRNRAVTPENLSARICTRIHSSVKGTEQLPVQSRAARSKVQRIAEAVRFLLGGEHVQNYAKSFYKSKAWQFCRASYIAERQSIDGGLCERCHQALGYIVHHKVAITPNNINDSMITLNHDNLQYLCKACHDEVHGYCGNQKEKPRCEFDEKGNPVPRRQ